MTVFVTIFQSFVHEREKEKEREGERDEGAQAVQYIILSTLLSPPHPP
jgi:hypothetical protein